jgi:hypothetical protein
VNDLRIILPENTGGRKKIAALAQGARNFASRKARIALHRKVQERRRSHPLQISL